MKENLNMGGKYSTADSGKFSTAIDTDKGAELERASITILAFSSFDRYTPFPTIQLPHE
ncbi:MAG: hypothetical protein M1477_05095 [Candidatus Thermoplasmatota archaeon]|nr:hypothetical protein [Candidatus Thermoplasmatota archaeon]